MKTKILFYSAQPYDIEFFNKWNKQYDFQIDYLDILLREKTVHLSKGYDAICIFVNDKVDSEIAKTLSENGIRMIALRCAGFNNVDLESTKKYNIKVVRVPAYSPHAIAEHAVSLILTLNRKTHKAYNRIREMNFSLNGLMGFDLYGKVVGVIGTGKIGAVFAQIMKGFGTEIIAYDPFPNQVLVDKNILTYVDLNDLFKKSDIISLHCPLTPETKYIINENTINLMKDGVMIINTGRGALIDTKAVINSLKKRKIGYLGLDVYEQEEKLFFEDHSYEIIEDDLIARLITFPNVLITAHQAFFTDTAMNEIAKITLSNIYEYFYKNHLQNEVVY